MFAEASLQGTIVQRVWRYDDAVRFYLCTRRATDGAADDPAQTHLIELPTHAVQCSRWRDQSLAHRATDGGHVGQRAGPLVSSGAG